MIENLHVNWQFLQNGFTALLVFATLLQMAYERAWGYAVDDRLREMLEEDDLLPENIEGPLEANVVYPEFRPAPVPQDADTSKALHLLSMMRHALDSGKAHQVERFRPRLEEAGIPIPESVEHCDTMMRALRGKEV